MYISLSFRLISLCACFVYFTTHHIVCALSHTLQYYTILKTLWTIGDRRGNDRTEMMTKTERPETHEKPKRKINLFQLLKRITANAYRWICLLLLFVYLLFFCCCCYWNWKRIEMVTQPKLWSWFRRNKKKEIKFYGFWSTALFLSYLFYYATHILMEPKSHIQRTIAHLPDFYDLANERDDSWKSLAAIATIDVSDRFVLIEWDKSCDI